MAHNLYLLIVRGTLQLNLMLRKAFGHPIVHIAVAAAILIGVVLCVFPQLIPSLAWFSNYAIQLMLFYLFAGLVMLFLKRPSLTFAFFGGCALLCFFLKYSVKSNGIERWRQNVILQQLPDDPENPDFIKLNIAHVNLTNANERSEIVSASKAAQTDLFSVHEVTPDWNRWLRDSLSEIYPFSHTLVDIGIYGMAVYSKYEIVEIDTFYYEEIPNLTGLFAKDGEMIRFISVHTLPALNSFSKRRLLEHMEVIGNFVNNTDEPILIFGDFNSVSWSEQIQHFLDKTKMMESRSGFMPFSTDGTFSFWDIPLDHIFFSKHWKCANFERLPGHLGQHLGISGEYHLSPRTPHAKKTSK